ncbi:hypothetical protein EUX98_g3384 [Antrodiella citrinella]|uniref:Uncharacterized protein n=1 Tax=Antrodiella citrinella TaxID=2447956 RepID=A0A4S4MWN3_9APHY|nr:hypothetical protein EUX98_g3384 [Antrodiella citrinella]
MKYFSTAPEELEILLRVFTTCVSEVNQHHYLFSFKFAPLNDPDITKSCKTTTHWSVY